MPVPKGYIVDSPQSGPPPGYVLDKSVLDSEEPKGPEHAKLEANSPLREYGLMFLHSLPTIGSTIGEMRGGPVGSAIGAGVGSTLENVPRFLTGNSQDAIDALKDIATEAGLSGAMSKGTQYLSKGGSRLKDYLMQKFSSFPIHGGEEGLKDVAATVQSGIPASVGQITQSPVAQTLERTMAPSRAKLAQQAEQEDFLNQVKNKFRIRFTGSPNIPESPAELYGAETKAIVRPNKEAAKRATDAAYDQVKFDADTSALNYKVKVGDVPTGVLDARGNPITTPQFRDVTVKGPIIYPKTGAFISKVLPEIEQLYKELPEAVKPKYDRLLTTMRKLDQGMVSSDPTSRYVADWQTVKEFRTAVNNSIGSKLDPTRAEGGLQKLATLLGKDVEDSVANIWEPKAPGALKRLQFANQLNAEEKTIFNKKVLKSAIGDKYNSADPSEVFKLAYKSPERAREMVQALSPEQQRPIKGYFYERLIDEVGNNPDRALKRIQNPQYRQVFSSSDRADLENFFRTMRRVQPDTKETGKYALTRYAAGIGLGLTADAINYSLDQTHRVPTFALAGATALVGSRLFAEKVLLNPRFARAASRLATLPPNADEAKFLRRSILTGLQGAHLVIHELNGDQHEAIVKDGKVVPQD